LRRSFHNNNNNNNNAGYLPPDQANLIIPADNDYFNPQDSIVINKQIALILNANNNNRNQN